MAEVLRPQFFVTRQNGAMVPLIAVDELPPDLTLVDVPRELTSHDIHDMKGVGTHQNRHRRYIIERLRGREQANSPTIPEALANPNIDVQSRRLPHALHEIHQKYHGVAESVPTNSISLRPYDQQAVYPVNHPPATYPYNATNNGVDIQRPFRILENIPIIPSRKKEYCSYWLRHGECDYAQQGCLYRHEMPTDRATLERLGLRDIPRWYREKHNIGSVVSNGLVSAKPGFLERTWRAEISVPVHPTGRVTEPASPISETNKREFELPAPPAKASATGKTSGARSGLQHSIHAQTEPAVQIQTATSSKQMVPRKPAALSTPAKTQQQTHEPHPGFVVPDHLTDPMPNYPALSPTPNTPNSNPAVLRESDKALLPTSQHKSPRKVKTRHARPATQPAAAALVKQDRVVERLVDHE